VLRKESPHREDSSETSRNSVVTKSESSDSITLTKSFIEACKSDNNSIVVDTLNVWHERLPEFDYEAIGAKYKSSEARKDD
jgi:FMN-dependent NADH-azoreductase